MIRLRENCETSNADTWCDGIGFEYYPRVISKADALDLVSTQSGLGEKAKDKGSQKVTDYFEPRPRKVYRKRPRVCAADLAEPSVDEPFELSEHKIQKRRQFFEELRRLGITRTDYYDTFSDE